MIKRALNIGLVLVIAISLFFPLTTNSERPEKAILWTRYLGEGLGFGAPIVDSERIYVACPTKIICFGLDSGELLWEKEFPRSNKEYALQINVSLGKEFVFFCNPDRLLCMNRQNGEQVWETKMPFTSNAEVIINHLYVASGNEIYRIDANTGRTLSQKSFHDQESYRFLTFAGKDKIIAATYYGTTKLLNMALGKVEWVVSNKLSNIKEKPVISGKKLIISGNVSDQNKILVLNLETGELVKEMNNSSDTQFVVSDGKLLLGNRCLDTDTLEALWFSYHGTTRSFDCFDAICFWQYDKYTIFDWNGNTTLKKEMQFSPGSNFYSDPCLLKPGTSNGRYAIVTGKGFLIGYGNTPESIIYTVGESFVTANSKKIALETKPELNNKGELVVDPVGFLEPLGWVSSHINNEKFKSLYMHDYKRQIELFDSVATKPSYIKMKRIPCKTNDKGTLVMPLDQMVTEFGLTMTKDGDKIKLSYQSK